MSVGPRDRAQLGAVIASRREGLRRRLDVTQTQLVDIRHARSDGTADDEHDPEGSTLSIEWSRAEGQREEAERELAELDAAHDRLAADEYGLCADCGGAIPLERLQLLPAALRCVPCASTETPRR